MSERRRKYRKIIVKHADEYSESEARLRIIKLILETKGRCTVPDECGRREQYRNLHQNKQG